MYAHRPRLFDHITLKVRNLERSKEFYRAVVEGLGHTISKEESDHFYVDGLLIMQNPEPTQAVHLSFEAPNPAVVNSLHEVAIKAGCQCVSSPGAIIHDNYSAMVLDPDGNNVEVIYRKSRAL